MKYRILFLLSASLLITACKNNQTSNPPVDSRARTRVHGLPRKGSPSIDASELRSAYLKARSVRARARFCP